MNCPKCKSPVNKAKALKRNTYPSRPYENKHMFTGEVEVWEHGKCACGEPPMFGTTDKTVRIIL